VGAVIFRSYQSILLECVDALKGGASVDECVARYPRHAERLEPDLRFAHKVSATPRAAARPGAQDQAWVATQGRIAELRRGDRPRAAVSSGRSFSPGLVLKPLAVSLVAIAFFVSAGGAFALAAQDAPPDSPLYTVKLTADDVRLWFVFDDGREAQILLEQSESRMDDIMSTVRDGDPVPENALADMTSRNERAAEIMLDNPDDTALRTSVLSQAQTQEDVLVALWSEVEPETAPEYTSAVAQLHNTRLDGGSGTAVAAIRPEELAGGIVDISGQAIEISGGLWDIGGVEVHVDDRTLGRERLTSGSSARFIIARSPNGRLYALSLSGLDTGPGPAGALVSGAIEEVREDGIVVGGNFIPFSSTTLRTTSIEVGELVHITLKSTDDGVVADSVYAADDESQADVAALSFEGTIEGDVKNTPTWTVGGLQFKITPRTTFDARAGSARNGVRVHIDAERAGSDLEALRITVLGSSDSRQVATMIGSFERYDPEEGIWVVSGLHVVPPETPEDPPAGALIHAVMERRGGDLVVADYTVLRTPEETGLVRLQGNIYAIDGAMWTMEFGKVRVDSTVDVSGSPDVGTRAIVWAERGRDGGLQGRYVVVLDDVPVLTPTPSPSPSPQPSP
jgi:hypothetical protein